ncbi:MULTISPECIES: hemerythrin domain-containing protein [unclassified Sphingomonas]|uniref:hemerythrin domain-containing protein n=1 Tax=unclassified Sphingomonas TaxID=196159 RepID=UPI0006F66A1D|nr:MULTISPECIES: hemerythrin domain-containing protein [unclassified Sphingomonas]KQX22670.1 hemerythrin [Sphingomonas sp. Root1294]KQY67851.1 hemerythrin [Sphingomonas sp. Root50]KRB88774.1 hemerythrin [Sphingomonas sp. Root720]
MLEEKTTRSFAIGAAAGLTAGLAANAVRKIFVQAPTMMAGEWDEGLAAEHRAVLKLFDQIQATESSHGTRRSILLTQIGHALAKHALEEENAVYAMLRTHGQVAEADRLNSDHGYVKQYLFELGQMSTSHPLFLSKIGDFRAMLEEHMRDEEEKIFPRLRGLLDEDENAALTKAMNQEGLKLA